MGLHDDAVERRAHAGEALGQGGLRLTGAGGGGTGLCGFELGLCGFEGGFGDEALGVQIAHPRFVGLCIGQFRLGLGHAGLRLGHVGLCGAVVDHGQGLALAHRVAGLDQQLRHATTGLRRHHAVLNRLQTAVERQARDRSALPRRHDGHLRPRGGGHRRFGFRASAQGTHQQQSRGCAAGAALVFHHN